MFLDQPAEEPLAIRAGDLAIEGADAFEQVVVMNRGLRRHALRGWKDSLESGVGCLGDEPERLVQGPSQRWHQLVPERIPRASRSFSTWTISARPIPWPRNRSSTSIIATQATSPNRGQHRSDRCILKLGDKTAVGLQLEETPPVGFKLVAIRPRP